MTRRGSYAVASLVLISMVVGCNTSPTVAAPCTGPVTVHVAYPASPHPQFTWSPDCEASQVNVVTNDSIVPALMWSVAFPYDSMRVRGPITYGGEPDGALRDSYSAPVPLKSGRSYLVAVVGMFPAAGLVILGEATFTH